MPVAHVREPLRVLVLASSPVCKLPLQSTEYRSVGWQVELTWVSLHIKEQVSQKNFAGHALALQSVDRSAHVDIV